MSKVLELLKEHRISAIVEKPANKITLGEALLLHHHGRAELLPASVRESLKSYLDTMQTTNVGQLDRYSRPVNTICSHWFSRGGRCMPHQSTSGGFRRTR